MNLVQIYIFGKAYLIFNTGTKAEEFIQTVIGTIDADCIANKRISDQLENVFSTALEYIDTPRDKQIVKGLIAEMTSVRFTAKLLGIKSRQGTTVAREALFPKLRRHLDIKKTSQLIRNDLTAQQEKLCQSDTCA